MLTRTPRVREMQRLQVELLLADHDQDCATCVRHGNCELQDVAQFVGLRQNRFADPALVAARPIDNSSPAMIRDMTKCIRCQRCVAMCRDGQGVDALVITGTGHEHRRRPAPRPVAEGIRPASPAASACWSARPARSASATRPTRVIDYPLRSRDRHRGPVRPRRCASASARSSACRPAPMCRARSSPPCRRIGVDIVLDTNFAADLVIMEEGTELLRPAVRGQRPTFTSCCPGWINFAERHYPDILPLLSSTKSPQQCLGAIAKTYLPEQDGHRPQAHPRRLDHAVHGQEGRGGAAAAASMTACARSTSVLTTREFARLLRREGIDFAELEPSKFDNPYMSEFSGAGAIFGTTGGVMEAARADDVPRHQRHANSTQIELEQLRGFEGVRTATVELGGAIGTVKVAMCHGLKPTREIVEAVLAGNGGFRLHRDHGLPRRLRRRRRQRCARRRPTCRSALKRRETLFGIDRKQKARQSHNNEQVQALYRDFLGAALLGEGAPPAAHLLHRPQDRDDPHGQRGLARDHHEHDDLLSSRALLSGRPLEAARPPPSSRHRCRLRYGARRQARHPAPPAPPSPSVRQRRRRTASRLPGVAASPCSMPPGRCSPAGPDRARAAPPGFRRAARARAARADRSGPRRSCRSAPCASSAPSAQPRRAICSCARPWCMLAGTATSIIFGLGRCRPSIRSTYSSPMSPAGADCRRVSSPIVLTVSPL